MTNRHRNFLKWQLIGNKNQPEVFLPKVFCTPWNGRPRIRVTDVRTQMLVFPEFEDPAGSFARDVRTKDAETPAVYPGRNLSLWVFSFVAEKTHTIFRRSPMGPFFCLGLRTMKSY